LFSGSSPRSSSIPVVGILGGIGSGKSSVVRHVKDLRLSIIDADQIGHQLLANQSIAEEIRRHFGNEVFDDQGQVSRARLAQLVFGPKAGSEANRRTLESILHPAIHQTIQDRINTTSHEVDVIIVDAALLLEAGWGDSCDRLVFIDTPADLRAERVIRDRGWPQGELQKREQAQWPVDRKRQAADYVIDNSGDIHSAAANLSQVLNSVLKPQNPSNSGPDQ
jgi:dephospho-CoA kinase